MKKEEFLRELEYLLYGISEEERADAVAFYRSYFEDAGEEKEASILAELESPQKVAESILKDLGAEPQNANREKVWNNGVPPKTDNTGMKVLLIILAILASPVWLTVLIVIAALIFSLLCVLLALAASAVTVMAALLITGVVLAVFGIALIPTGSPAAGLGLFGGGCVVFALGVLALLFVVLVCGAFLPWAVKGIFGLCKKPFDKRRGRVA